MPSVQLPALATKRRAWNKGRIIGQKRPLLPKQVWAIRARLELARNLRDLALFNVAIDSKIHEETAGVPIAAAGDEGGGEASVSRLGTLLPLFRNFIKLQELQLEVLTDILVTEPSV